LPICFVHDDTIVAADLLIVHHIKPQAFGGPDVPENRALLCASCHDVLHKAEVKLSKGKQGLAFDLIDRFLPNQTVRQQRLRMLVTAMANARRDWTPNTDIPESGVEAETVIMQLDVPVWIHHRLKTAAQDHKLGLYNYCLKILEQHVQDLGKSKTLGAASPTETALVLPKKRELHEGNILDRADLMELSGRMLMATTKTRYVEIISTAVARSPLPRALEDGDFTRDDAAIFLRQMFEKAKRAQQRDGEELYCAVLIKILGPCPVVAQIAPEIPHFKSTKWLATLLPENLG
jgi:hypothetical protein